MISNEKMLEMMLKGKDAKQETKKSLFIFGISGFVGKRVANFCATKLRGEFAEVGGTTRAKTEGSSSEYHEYVIGDDGSLPADAVAALRRATHVLSTVPPTTDNTLDDGSIELNSKGGLLQWAGYLSTTATYGDRGGTLADEDDEVDEAALSERGKARLRIEEKWRRTGAPVHIFRLPGIYGPGRGPLAKAREPSNRLILKENQVFCRVHVDDIVQALILSMRKPNPGRVYNICDNEPASSHSVALYAYSLLNKQPPPLVRYEDVESTLAPMVKSFYSECKRVQSDRAKLELGFFPIYPSYREGFVAQLEEEGTDFHLIPVSSSADVVKPFRKPVSPSFSSLTNGSHPLQVVRSIHDVLVFFLSYAKSLLHRIRLWLLLKLFDITVLLVDNGSVRPAATLGMRRLAHKLQSVLGMRVVATSYRYADSIDKAKLEGKNATLLRKALEEERAKFIVIMPLFLGPSAVITRDVPKLLSRSTQLIGKPLVDVNATHCMITTLLVNAALDLIKGKTLTKKTKFLLVDHGSPHREVNRVRRALAARVRARLFPAVVVDCSMERREEPEYDFNEPTLENALKLGGFNRGEVLVIPAFLFPGNHAGPGGDIERIIDEATKKNPFLSVRTGRLILDEVNDDVVIKLLAANVKSTLL